MMVDREALEGIFGFFQVASNYGVSKLTSSTFTFSQDLLSYTTILVRHVLPYVSGATWKSCEGLMRSIPKEPHRRVCHAMFCHTCAFRNE